MSFERALPIVLASEGGYVNDPDDRGGATNFGITQRRYDLWRADRDLPQRSVKLIEQSEVAAFYREEWDSCKADAMPWPISLLHFDATVNHGPNRAAILLQDALGVTADGRIGPITIRAANIPDPAMPYRILLERVDFYRRISGGTQLKFLRGWLDRIRKLRESF